MKLDLTDDQLAAHSAASWRGLLEGTAFGTAVATAGSLFSHRRFPGYQALPNSLKALGAIIVIAPAAAIQAERRGLEYDRTQWSNESTRHLSRHEQEDIQRWNALSTSDKIVDWTLRHQYSIIMGGWALGLAASGSIIWKDKYQSPAQKVVQIRMWAQGLTIGLLMAGGALNAFHRSKFGSDKHPADHSWQDVVEQREYEKKEAQQHALAKQES